MRIAGCLTWLPIAATAWPAHSSPPDDWRQTDFAHRFTDELKAMNDSAVANFGSAKKLTGYTGDERKQLAHATAAAFRAMDFDSNETGSPLDSPSSPGMAGKWTYWSCP